MKSIMRMIICLLWLITQQACGQKYTYSDKYDFQFKYDQQDIHSQPWNISRLSWLSTIQELKEDNGQHLFTFYHPKNFPFTRNLIVECDQRILLPLNNEEDGKVTLSFKGDNIESAELIVTGLDKEEGCLYSDTLMLKVSSTIGTASASVSLSNVKLLHIKIVAFGLLDRESTFSLAGVDIFLGNKAIDTYSLADSESDFNFPLDKIIPLDINSIQGFSEIESLKKKRIIAVGESVHGSSSIAKLIPSFIKQQIVQNNCRLVLCEIPLERTLIYNRYIHDTSFAMEKDYLFGIEFETLLEWLREYNSHKKESEKVSILGMDYCNYLNSENATSSYLFDYLTLINKKNRSREIDTLSIMLLEKPLREAMNYVQSQKKLEKELSPEDYKCITHILTLSESMGTDENKRLIARDSVMFENTKFLISNFCPADARTFIHGHSGHLNRISGYPFLPDVISLGAMMSRYYHDDYYSITVLVENGSLFLPNVKMVRNCYQLENLESTLETTLAKVGHDMYFTYIPECLDKPIFSRYVASIFKKQCFYPFNIYRRHDGIIFIRNTECDLDAINEKKISESLKEHAKSSENRLKLLNEIKLKDF